MVRRRRTVMASSTMAMANGVASEKGADGKARNMAAEPTDHDARSVRDGARGSSIRQTQLRPVSLKT